MLWRRALATTSSEGGMPGRMVRQPGAESVPDALREGDGQVVKQSLTDDSRLDEMVGVQLAPDGVAYLKRIGQRYERGVAGVQREQLGNGIVHPRSRRKRPVHRDRDRCRRNSGSVVRRKMRITGQCDAAGRCAITGTPPPRAPGIYRSARGGRRCQDGGDAVWPDGWSTWPRHQPARASFTCLAGAKPSLREAAIAIISPVAGLRPWPGGLCLTLNLPNPGSSPPRPASPHLRRCRRASPPRPPWRHSWRPRPASPRVRRRMPWRRCSPASSMRRTGRRGELPRFRQVQGQGQPGPSGAQPGHRRDDCDRRLANWVSRQPSK